MASSLAFNKLLNELKLIKIHPSNSRISWSDFRVQVSLARLDRCFVNTSWHTIYPLISCPFLSRITSDHTPLRIDLLQYPKTNKGVRKTFKFENLWYSYTNFETTIKDSWTRGSSSTDLVATLVLKQRRLRVDLRKWRETVGGIFQAKKDLINKIQTIDKLEEDNVVSRPGRVCREPGLNQS